MPHSSPWNSSGFFSKPAIIWTKLQKHFLSSHLQKYLHSSKRAELEGRQRTDWNQAGTTVSAKCFPKKSNVLPEMICSSGTQGHFWSQKSWICACIGTNKLEIWPQRPRYFAATTALYCRFVWMVWTKKRRNLRGPSNSETCTIRTVFSLNYWLPFFFCLAAQVLSKELQLNNPAPLKQNFKKSNKHLQRMNKWYIWFENRILWICTWGLLSSPHHHQTVDRAKQTEKLMTESTKPPGTYQYNDVYNNRDCINAKSIALISKGWLIGILYLSC